MAECALLLSLLLHQPYGVVETVYYFAGLDGVAVVTMESQWHERALRQEPRGHTSWGYWQIDNEWHEQYRDDVLLHLAEGASILTECKAESNGDFAMAVAHYNGGDHIGAYSRWWGKQVKKKRDSPALYLWRRMR